MLTVAQLLTVLDSMAAAVPVLESALGITGLELNTVGWAASRNVDTLTAINDRSVQADLVAAFVDRSQRVLAPYIYSAITARQIQRALDTHFANAGGLSEFLRANLSEVHPDLLKIGLILDADVLFSPVAVDPMATFTLTAPAAGVLLIGGSIDSTAYGDARLAIRTTTAIGAAAINASVRTQTRAGTESAQAIVIPAASPINTRIALPVRGSRVTAITVTTGTAADQFKVVSEVERAVVL
jgi:hypothetical protein